MGIFTEIHNQYLSGTKTPCAFLILIQCIFDTHTDHRNHFIIDDALLWLPYRFNNETHFIPRDWLNAILTQASEYFKSRGLFKSSYSKIIYTRKTKY